MFPSFHRVTCVLFAIAFAAFGFGCGAAAPVEFEVGEFKPVAQRSIVPRVTNLEILWNDGDFTEGPAAAPDGSIYFTDIGNRILRFRPDRGVVTVYREPSGRANGLMFDPQGRLVACEGANTGGGRRISITEADGAVRTLADAWDGKRFNSPNDLAIDKNGRVYFTDPRYAGDEPRQIDFEGVFLVDTDGTVTLATREVAKPNGILIAPNQRTVYIADHDSAPGGVKQFLAFDVQADGTLANKRVLYDFGPDQRGIDGMTLDTRGNIYATAGRGDDAGVYVFSPRGKHLARIRLPGDPTNCTFGRGKDATSLYITAQGPRPDEGPRRYALYRVKLLTKGYHVAK